MSSLLWTSWKFLNALLKQMTQVVAQFEKTSSCFNLFVKYFGQKYLFGFYILEQKPSV